jgi:hypothetical protein
MKNEPSGAKAKAVIKATPKAAAAAKAGAKKVSPAKKTPKPSHHLSLSDCGPETALLW